MPKSEWKRENVWLRALLMAPTGGGKTLGALALAANLFPDADPRLPIVGIDTEYERMKLYADQVPLAEYRVLRDSYSPEAFIREIDEVEAAFTGGILILDSVTHEWSGTDGVLEIVDQGAGGNWKDGTPRHNRFVDRLMRLNMHLICCCRAKMKWDYSVNERGKREQKKLGVGPEQRDNFLYNFDVIADIDVDTHLATFSNRCRPLVDQTLSLVPDPGNLYAPNPVAATLTSWLSEGEPMPEPPAAADTGAVEALVGLLRAEGVSADLIAKGFDRSRRENRGVLTVEYVATKTAEALARAAAQDVAAKEEVPV